MELHLAPVQGHTDPAYRHYFKENFKGIDRFYTPFIRWEKEGLRLKDLKEIENDFNRDIDLVPQVIFRNIDELKNLIEKIAETGYNQIDLNMGCPFPLQTSKGRGAAVIGNHPLVEQSMNLLESFPEIAFSAKLRLGLKSKDEWKEIVDMLNSSRLEHITLHPRVAAVQYKGEADIESFREFAEKINKPLIYNGDLRTSDDIKHINKLFPSLKGIMLGRGLLGMPTLAEEYLSDTEYSQQTRLSKMIDFHNQLLDYYESVLCGDSQILNKIKPFWEYSEQLIGRKAYKAINKSINMAKYRSALALIGN